MPDMLIPMLTSPSVSPTGAPLDDAATGRTLYALAIVAVVFLFLMAGVATLRKRNSGLDM